MRSRYLQLAVEELALNRYKMAFISGPRQCGKTTLAKAIMGAYPASLYANWDDVVVRRQWTKSPMSLLKDLNLGEISQDDTLVIFDEIHKSPKWKQRLKGVYDQVGDQLKIIVTGSAKLNILRRGGDSMMGRYFHFRLHPFSLGELYQSGIPLKIQEFSDHLFTLQQTSYLKKLVTDSKAKELLLHLDRTGGFPEPFLAQSPEIVQLWRQGRLEKVVRQDLSDLSKIQEIGYVEALMSLLPERVGSTLSITNLREDLEVSFDTVKKWLSLLEELYYCYRIRPYHQQIIRSLKKEPKLYLYDWSEVESDGARFENLIASHLLKACHYWQDTGQGLFELHFLRDKQKQEIDFLVTKNKRPWFTVEAKKNQTALDLSCEKLRVQLGVPHLQVVMPAGYWKYYPDQKTYVMSAQGLLGLLP